MEVYSQIINDFMPHHYMRQTPAVSCHLFFGVVLPRISAVWHTPAAMGWAKRDQPSSAHAETIKPARLSPSPLRIPSVCPPDTRRSTANPD